MFNLRRILQRDVCDLQKNITFSENRPAGDSFHVMGKQVHTIIAHVCVSDVEIMWDKVPWVLREVRLYTQIYLVGLGVYA